MEAIVIDLTADSDSEPSSSFSSSPATSVSVGTPAAVVQPVEEETSHFFETPERDRPIESIEVVQPWSELNGENRSATAGSSSSGDATVEDEDDVQIVEVRAITNKMSRARIERGGSRTGTASTVASGPQTIIPKVKKREPSQEAKIIVGANASQVGETVEAAQNKPSVQNGQPTRPSQQPSLRPVRGVQQRPPSTLSRTATPDGRQRPPPPPSSLLPAAKQPPRQQNNPFFTFQRGTGSNGDVFFTVSQVVGGASMSFRDLPDLPGRGLRNALKIARQKFIQKSVIGALVYIDAAGSQHILKTAVSSNIGPGDRIWGGEAPSAKLLWKPVWRQRVIKLAPLLKQSLRSIYDGQGKKDSGKGEEKAGSYNSAHVEKKLATFLLYTLLEDFGITTKDSFAAVQDIRKLRDMLQKDPRRMRFEILVSRKWCSNCGLYVRKLASASGIEVIIRVQPVVEALPPPKGRAISAYQENEKDSQLAPSTRTVGDSATQGETFHDDELEGAERMNLDRARDEDGDDDSESSEPMNSDNDNDHDKADISPGEHQDQDAPPQSYSSTALSEPRVLELMYEEENDLFCPMPSGLSKVRTPMAEQDGDGSGDVSMMGVALTEEEEADLFGSPEPPAQSMSSVREEQHDSPMDQTPVGPRSRDINPSPGHHSASPMGNTQSPEPILPGISDEGDDLFLPLHEPDHQPQANPSPEPPSSDPSPDPSPERDWEVIVIEDTPPPPSAETVANFARITAEHAYRPPRGAIRRPGPPMSIDVARERVFQKKPLPATPVIEEPFSPIETQFARPERRERVAPRRATHWRMRNVDPVFQQLEMEL